MRFPFLRAALALVALLALSADARAQFVYSDTTAGGPTFNRPLENGTALSGTGTNVPYHVLAFSVDAAGTYGFLSGPTTGGFNNFLILYQNAFNPTAALDNFVIADDDVPQLGVVQAGFSAPLAVGTNYFLVTTGFNNADFGAFTNIITGPGNVLAGPAAAVPEPGTLALLGFVLPVGAAAIRRRRA